MAFASDAFEPHIQLVTPCLLAHPLGIQPEHAMACSLPMSYSTLIKSWQNSRWSSQSIWFILSQDLKLMSQRIMALLMSKAGTLVPTGSMERHTDPIGKEQDLLPVLKRPLTPQGVIARGDHARFTLTLGLRQSRDQ